MGLLQAQVLSSASIIGGLALAPGWSRAPGMISPRDPVVIGPQAFLRPQGLGLANVLYNMRVNHPNHWEALVSAFRSEFRFVRRIEFPVAAGGAQIHLTIDDERFPGRPVFASEMSDGMIAYLCLLAALLHPWQIGVLGLDEPETGLHPSALSRLVAIAHEKGIGQVDYRRNVVIVTHSDELLDELTTPDESIRIVDSTKEGAHIAKLDATALKEWRKVYALRDLRRDGFLDSPNAAYGTPR